MEIHKFFFKLAISLFLLLIVYFQTTLQQQPSIAPAPSHAHDQGPSLPPEEVDAVEALLKLMDNKRTENMQPNISFSKICHSETYWGYFKCDCKSNTTCRVMGLDFSKQRIEGSIPKEIGFLSSLMTLDLSNNMFSGTIPGSFANLSKLKSMVDSDLNNNQLEGHIPSFLLKMKSLEKMRQFAQLHGKGHNL